MRCAPAAVASAVALVAGGCGGLGQGDHSQPTGTIAVADSEDLRRIFLVPARGGSVEEVRTPTNTRVAELSPDGRHLVAVDEEGFRVFSRNGGDAKLVTVQPSTSDRVLGSPSWSPDATRLVFDDGGGLTVLRIETGDRRQILSGDDIYDPDWSPAHDLIAFVRDPTPKDGDESMGLVGVDGSNVRRLGRGQFPAISPDGSEIAFVRDGDVFTMEMRGRPELFVRDASHPEWSPDGKFLAYTRNVECGEPGCVGRVFIAPAARGSARAVGPEIFDMGPFSWSE
jgi:Tol biopolymer transport system component